MDSGFLSEDGWNQYCWQMILLATMRAWLWKIQLFVCKSILQVPYFSLDHIWNTNS